MVEKNYKAGADAFVAEGVHPALDNRIGLDRPPLEDDPAVPQQIDGPDLLHQAEHAEAVERARREADDVARKGMFSPGDHGLGDLAARERGDQGYDAGQAADVLETDPGNPNSAPTGLDGAGAGATQEAGSRGSAPASAKDKGSEGDVNKGDGKSTSSGSGQRK